MNVATRRPELNRVLVTAALEINSEIDLPADSEPLDQLELALVTEVNLERAVEHWQQMQSRSGSSALAAKSQPPTSRDSWDRHAHKLAPLKPGGA